MNERQTKMSSLSDDEITTTQNGSAADICLDKWFQTNVADPAWQTHGDKLQRALKPLQRYNTKRKAQRAAAR